MSGSYDVLPPRTTDRKNKITEKKNQKIEGSKRTRRANVNNRLRQRLERELFARNIRTHRQNPTHRGALAGSGIGQLKEKIRRVERLERIARLQDMDRAQEERRRRREIQMKNERRVEREYRELMALRQLRSYEDRFQGRRLPRSFSGRLNHRRRFNDYF
ncbi:hypothetical protein EIN_248790 [Entamoeba invadens IP1]|uniref:Uncharacterized protein n=1 Tax=Entamoeba invadens IP1 TaxID=370355 RepID=A0A0A1UE43_ENTIV|nr:hypothetical protein EIN_248790 [Entamoeba invadens IP1]ELP94865.1 hypothetical protein EIN_248790 [Entamoeba invadens IP1]|eukprot:XP_004261636.1 hypothetical protein EIN_248790 [Entamoeba invadens IP1]